jgi:hypothetical protein
MKVVPRGRALLGALLIFGTASCAGSASERVTGEVEDWQRVTSAEGRFMVLMPGKATTRTAPIPDALFPDHPGATVQATAYAAEDWSSWAFYTVLYWDYPGAGPGTNVAALLDRITDHVVSNKTVEWRKSVSLNGHPGREFRATYSADGQSAAVQQRLYWADGRVYQVGVAWQADKAGDGRDKFFNSFEIENEGAARR